MDIGQRVREVREDLGMQRTVLARRVGAAENTIYRIETGKRTPSVELLEKIARELRTEPAEFLREPVPLDETPETGLAGADPPGFRIDAKVLEDIAELWVLPASEVSALLAYLLETGMLSGSDLQEAREEGVRRQLATHE